MQDIVETLTKLDIEIYGQISESREDGEVQPNEGDNRQETDPKPITGTDGDGIDAGRQRQDPDSPNIGDQGKPKPKRTTGTGNDPGKPILNLNQHDNSSLEKEPKDEELNFTTRQI